MAKPAPVPKPAAPTPPVTKKDPPVQEPAKATPVAPVKQTEAAKHTAEAKLAPLAALSSLFGGKSKPNAAVAPGVKISAKTAVKPVADFSFFGKLAAPQASLARAAALPTLLPVTRGTSKLFSGIVVRNKLDGTMVNLGWSGTDAQKGVSEAKRDGEEGAAGEEASD